jgi:hypothetical protein
VNVSSEVTVKRGAARPYAEHMGAPARRLDGRQAADWLFSPSESGREPASSDAEEVRDLDLDTAPDALPLTVVDAPLDLEAALPVVAAPSPPTPRAPTPAPAVPAPAVPASAAPRAPTRTPSPRGTADLSPSAISLRGTADLGPGVSSARGTADLSPALASAAPRADVRLDFAATTPWPSNVPSVEQLARWIAGTVAVPSDAAQAYSRAVASLAEFERALPLHDASDALVRAVLLRLRLAWAVATQPAALDAVDEQALVALALEGDPALEALKDPALVERYGRWVDEVRNALVRVGFDVGELKVEITSDLADAAKPKREAPKPVARVVEAAAPPAPRARRGREGLLATLTVASALAAGWYHLGQGSRAVASMISGTPSNVVGVHNPTSNVVVLRATDGSPAAQTALEAQASMRADYESRTAIQTAGSVLLVPPALAAPLAPGLPPREVQALLRGEGAARVGAPALGGAP